MAKKQTTNNPDLIANLEKTISQLQNTINLQEEKYTQLKNLLDTLPGDIYWKDLNGVWSGMNKRCAQSLHRMKFINECNETEVIGKTDYEIFSKQNADIYRANDLEVIEKNIELSREEIAHLPSGETVILLSTKRPLLDNKGQVVGIVGNTIDISYLKKIESALKKAKEEAEAASRAKDLFIRNMSHDIRTPLSGIIGISSILEQKAHNVKEKEHAHMINMSGEQLLTLLNNVLDVIVPESQKENKVNLSTCNVQDLIRTITDLERPTITFKKLKLLINIDLDTPKWITTDTIKLHRILLNLLGNAIKFTEKGFIEIGVKPKLHTKGKILLEFFIKDSGPGIKPKDKDKIFKRFYRAAHSYQGSYATGHGVGLHIVKHYTQLLKGKIQVDSTIDVGTIFTLTIPVKIAENPTGLQELTLPVPPEKSITIKPNNTPLVLLIEDNAIALKMVENMLQQLDIRFLSASTGTAALELFKSHTFDCILSDIGLPDCTGILLAQQFRQYEQTQNKRPTPIIGLTAHTISDIEDECLHAGMNQIITKPIHNTTLMDLLAQYNKDHLS